VSAYKYCPACKELLVFVYENGKSGSTPVCEKCDYLYLAMVNDGILEKPIAPTSE
jgi:DNA-directed RNA polymerase subunit M/transcription elongation factor TFIIS